MKPELDIQAQREMEEALVHEEGFAQSPYYASAMCK